MVNYFMVKYTKLAPLNPIHGELLGEGLREEYNRSDGLMRLYEPYRV